jgi:hypothetical protein
VAAVVPLHHLVAGDERAERHPRGDALGQGDDVGLEPEVLAREQAAGAAHTALHLVRDQEDPVGAGDLAQLREEARMGHHVAALSLHRLHDHRRHLGRIHGGAEHGLGEEVEALHVAGLGTAVHGAAVAVRVVGVQHLGHEGTVALALDGLARGEAHGPVGAPVERAVEGHDLLTTGAQPRELDGALHDLGPRVREEHAEGARARGAPRQVLGQRHDVLVVEVGGAHVQEAIGLALDRRHHLGVAVAGGGHRDPGREVEVAVAVGVLHHRPLRPLHDQGVVLRVVLRDHAQVALDDRAGARAGRRCREAWIGLGHG